MPTTTGTNGETIRTPAKNRQRAYSNIKFYCGCDFVDPTENNFLLMREWYSNGDGTGTLDRSKFDAYLEQFHTEPRLDLNGSYYQRIEEGMMIKYGTDEGATSTNPNGVSIEDFQQTNINFVRIENVNPNLGISKVYYAEYSQAYAHYQNDGVIFIDVSVNEFYTNMFYMQFGYSKVEQMHVEFEADSRTIKKGFEDSFRIREPYAANVNPNGGTSTINLAPTDVWWLILEYYVEPSVTTTITNNGASNSDNVWSLHSMQPSNLQFNDLGIGSMRSYLIIPFNPYTNKVYGIYDDNTFDGADTTDGNGYYHYAVSQGWTVSQLLWHLSNDSADANHAGWTTFAGGTTGIGNGMSVVFNVGFGNHYTVDSNNRVHVNISGANGYLLRGLAYADSNWHDFCCLLVARMDTAGQNNTKRALPYNFVPTNPSTRNPYTLYELAKSLMQEYINETYTGGITNMPQARYWLSCNTADGSVGWVEKLAQYVMFNVFVADQPSFSFDYTEAQASVNNTFQSYLVSSPHQSMRTDIIVEPYANNYGVGGDVQYPTGFNSWLLRKGVTQMQSSIPFSISAYSNYYNTNQISMNNSIAQIQGSNDIAHRQNDFTLGQAQLQNQYQIENQGLMNQQAMAMTGQTNWQGLNMQAFQAGTSVLGGALNGSTITQHAWNTAAAGINAAPQMNMAYAQAGYNVQNQALANLNATNMTAQQAAQSNNLASQSRSFGNKIADQSEALQLRQFYSGINNLKNQAASVVSGGSMLEFQMFNGWNGVHIIATFPQPQELVGIAQGLTMYGSRVNIWTIPSNYFFTKQKVNYIKCTRCNILPSSMINTLSRVNLENLFQRGISIWHDSKQMATRDYKGNVWA